MKRRAFLGFLLVLGLAAPVAAQTEMTDPFKGPLPDTNGVEYKLGPNLDPRVIDFSKDLGCICGTCPHEPVSTCTCGTAERIRAQVALGISQNKDHDAILGMLVERFGESIIPKPPFSGFNLIAWLGPFALMIGAVVWLRLVALKRWQAQGAKAAAAQKPAPASDPYMAAVDAEMKARGR